MTDWSWASSWCWPVVSGTLVDPIAADAEPLTIAQGKLRAGLDWTDGDARDALMAGFIASARAKVEHDTGLALPTQARDLVFDALPASRVFWSASQLPPQSTPLQAVVSVTSFDAAGVAHVLDPAAYTADVSAGRLGLTILTPPTDLRSFRAWTVQITAGYPDAEHLPPPLLHAVGLLTAHFATLGRDVAVIGAVSSVLVPYGYAEAIAPYRIEVVA